MNECKHKFGCLPKWYERYSPCLSYLDYSLSPRAGSSRTLEERNSSQVPLLGSSSSIQRMGMKSPVIADAPRQATQPRARFDPFTGEPYKFDPYTGEPIQPESLPHGSRSLY
ncbi:DNA-directed RNA polymerase subunit beta [Bienertia sinuspersici]